MGNEGREGEILLNASWARDVEKERGTLSHGGDERWLKGESGRGRAEPEGERRGARSCGEEHGSAVGPPGDLARKVLVKGKRRLVEAGLWVKDCPLHQDTPRVSLCLGEDTASEGICRRSKILASSV